MQQFNHSPVRVQRDRKGWSQEHLAEKSGLSRGLIGYIERAPSKLTRRAAARLAVVLGCAMSDLIVNR